MSGDARTVVLVDLSHLFWSSWHACKGPVNEAFEATLTAVARCRKEGDLVAICCDEGRSFRKDKLPEYKANRPEKDATALDTLRRVKERLRDDGLLLWGKDGFEADDVIGGATELATERGHKVLVCTADKDLLQLTANEAVTVLRTYGQWERWTGETVRKPEKFGIEPYQIPDWLALVGDVSDNIKGADGVGAKTATSLLQQFGDVPGIYEAIAADASAVLSTAKKGEVSKACQKLIACEKQVRLALDLVRLNPPELDFSEIYKERPVKPIASTGGETMEESDTQTEESHDEAPVPQKAEPTRETAIVTREIQRPFEHGLEPTSAQTAWVLAKHYANSTLYKRFPNPEAILAVIMLGREWGYGAAQSLELFHFFEGRVVPHAHLIIAKVMEHPDCEYMQLLHSDWTKAVYEIKNRRSPKPYVHTYTMDDAAKAGLSRRPIWQSRGPEMLRKTCAVQCGRIAIPGAALGLYAFEEMTGDE